MSSVRVCPSNAFRYNGTLCSCIPGYLLNATTGACSLFRETAADRWQVNSGVDYTISFPTTIFDFDKIKKFTQSQAMFLEATVAMLISWLLFCFLVRFGSLGDGRTTWFRIRWWISRLDISFATRHWLEDQKVVKKRKTELGGTFSIASWILFIGLFSALLYQIISKRSVEVHNIKATNAPDLASFINDMEFNITTISSMTCSNLRGLGNLVAGDPSFLDNRILPLSTFVNYFCHNTSRGPTITLKCSKCQLIQDNLYISWHFVDLPNSPAAAVGFQFSLLAKSHASKKHVSTVSGLLKNGSSLDGTPVTFRGVVTNVLKFNLFPQLYRNFHDLRLIRPLFREFLPGPSFHEMNNLRDSLENPNDGILNMTLYVNLLSSYIVEIDNQNIMGPVSFLADLGGLYCISIGIFFYFLVQCEYRMKKFRNEDIIMRKIRNRRKAQQRWDKLRKYVMYTWGCKTLDESYNNNKKETTCMDVLGSCHCNGSSRERRQKSRMDSICLNQKAGLPSQKNTIQETRGTQEVKSCLAGTASTAERSPSHPKDEPVMKNEVLGGTKEGRQHVGSHEGDASQHKAFYLVADDVLPPPPMLDFKPGFEIDMSDIQKNLQNLYEYNVVLREKLLTIYSSSSGNNGAVSDETKPRIENLQTISREVRQ